MRGLVPALPCLLGLWLITAATAAEGRFNPGDYHILPPSLRRCSSRLLFDTGQHWRAAPDNPGLQSWIRLSWSGFCARLSAPTLRRPVTGLLRSCVHGPARDLRPGCAGGSGQCCVHCGLIGEAACGVITRDLHCDQGVVRDRKCVGCGDVNLACCAVAAGGNSCAAGQQCSLRPTTPARHAAGSGSRAVLAGVGQGCRGRTNNQPVCTDKAPRGLHGARKEADHECIKWSMNTPYTEFGHNKFIARYGELAHPEAAQQTWTSSTMVRGLDACVL